MRFGRRIKTNGENGDITWCELGQEEVGHVLKKNVRLNADIFQECFQEALARMNVTRPEDRAALAVNAQLKREVQDLALALFEKCAVKSFIALQEALDEKVHETKVHAFA